MMHGIIFIQGKYNGTQGVNLLNQELIVILSLAPRDPEEFIFPCLDPQYTLQFFGL
jgi:hypothetical protein